MHCTRLPGAKAVQDPLVELRQLRLCNVEGRTGVLGVIALLQLLLSRAIQEHLQIALYLQDGCQVCPATFSIGMGRLQGLLVERSGLRAAAEVIRLGIFDFCPPEAKLIVKDQPYLCAASCLGLNLRLHGADLFLQRPIVRAQALEELQVLGEKIVHGRRGCPLLRHHAAWRLD
ncbi:unnamed protein product [Polarella glacialis]|uniref:Uncharacterized protein n=1 Tax=Polarella glacialis TaxID=89957 RepID=A0A813K5Q8_POLGL|nr:unnamed protein product [Polarella glacialis]